ncbi:hypothetical protein SMACR_07755 [Sordaria macrospora]|uniref:WGS project CABT00000000 data, contig 2.47 n=2 Tax=Sordaria macrospora TaxID=5147 RepID=F7W8X5_SORMK|nr:uncharacterized protein SMAC_07755 [Sordaria macrospora k-hell]KAA8630706.1 hypothetical protein SMACR_07755 [Sordaria macrospora]WPJ66426.1 hypothetical protein SMAC4_07755 [Sordaria macrospora]CCC05098.1 unnamed protein product [Sordaria macrospora k-hell]
MKFTTLTTLLLTATLPVNAAVLESDTSVLRRDIFARQNANRPVPNGACCVANTSLKQDICRVNGRQGKCVPANTANCEYPWRREIDMYRGLEVDLQP